jgi:hypothetical protein
MTSTLAIDPGARLSPRFPRRQIIRVLANCLHDLTSDTLWFSRESFSTYDVRIREIRSCAYRRRKATPARSVAPADRRHSHEEPVRGIAQLRVGGNDVRRGGVSVDAWLPNQTNQTVAGADAPRALPFCDGLEIHIPARGFCKSCQRTDAVMSYAPSRARRSYCVECADTIGDKRFDQIEGRWIHPPQGISLPLT